MNQSTTMRLFAAPALLAFLLACSSPSTTGGSGGGAEAGSSSASGAGGGGCPLYQVPAGTDLTTPAVSLKTDVMQVFNANCGAAACHGSATMGMGGLFLGSETAMGSDAAQVRTGLVGVLTEELTTMPYVTAGDPTKSYLMHKMDGDQCHFDAQCAGGTCLVEMPNGLGTTLPVATRDIVRRWIAQGAADN
jgi:hypothetical protein